MFQNDLGAMYYIGEIIKKDFVQAKYWFEKSAGQGNN
ncbi:SEL1-like repeat protein, partial [Escherichia coli]